MSPQTNISLLPLLHWNLVRFKLGTGHHAGPLLSLWWFWRKCRVSPDLDRLLLPFLLYWSPDPHLLCQQTNIHSIYNTNNKRIRGEKHREKHLIKLNFPWYLKPTKHGLSLTKCVLFSCYLSEFPLGRRPFSPPSSPARTRLTQIRGRPLHSCDRNRRWNMCWTPAERIYYNIIFIYIHI